MGEREIIACAKFEEELKVNAPQEVTLSFVCENGLYRTNTELKYVNYEEPYILFVLKTPQGLVFLQAESG